MILSAPIVPAAILFVFVLGTVLGTYWLFVVRPETQAAGAVRRRLKHGTAGARVVTSQLLKSGDEMSSIGPIDFALRRVRGLTAPLEVLIEQSGVQVTPGALMLSCVVAALTAIVIGQFVLRMAIVGLVAAPIVGMLPILFVRFMRARRINKFEEQFPEALDLLTRSLKAGHALTSGIALVAEEMPQPVGPEFRLLHDRQNYGMPFPDALSDFARRIPVLDAKFFATAILIQRESGGNLSEILTKLSAVIRERFKVKRQVRALSAHARITGWVLAGLPPGLVLTVMAIDPDHFQSMISTPLGRKMIAVGVGLQLFGMFIIRHLVRPEY